MVLYSATNVKIEYCDKSGILSCIWSGFQTDEVIIESGEKILVIILDKNIKKIFNDNRNVKGLWLDEWARQTWFPRVINSGVKRFAWIYSENTFARISAKRAAGGERVKGFVIKEFDNTNEAYNWLNETD